MPAYAPLLQDASDEHHSDYDVHTCPGNRINFGNLWLEVRPTCKCSCPPR